MLIGTLIRLYRERHGISLRKMAKIIGVDVNALCRFEHGKDVATAQWTKIVKWVLTAENENRQKDRKT